MPNNKIFRQTGTAVAAAGALQLLLLLLLYQPFPKVLDTRVLDWLYFALFAGTTLALVGLAYRAFSQRRALAGLMAAVLAFPGMAYWVMLLSLLVQRH